MEHLLNFLTDLMILTGGLVVVMFWIVVIVAVSVEIYDAIFDKSSKEDDDA